MPVGAQAATKCITTPGNMMQQGDTMYLKMVAQVWVRVCLFLPVYLSICLSYRLIEQTLLSLVYFANIDFLVMEAPITIMAAWTPLLSAPVQLQFTEDDWGHSKKKQKWLSLNSEFWH